MGCDDTWAVGVNIGKCLVKAPISLRLLILLFFYPRFGFVAIPVFVVLSSCMFHVACALSPPPGCTRGPTYTRGGLRVPVIYVHYPRISLPLLVSLRASLPPRTEMIGSTLLPAGL